MTRLRGGKDNHLNIYGLKKDDVIQVRNVVRKMLDKDATKELSGEAEISGEDESGQRVVKKVKIQSNKYARFRLNRNVDEDSTLHDSMQLIKDYKNWSKIEHITFHFIEHPNNRDYKKRETTMYDESSLNMFYETDSMTTVQRKLAVALSLPLFTKFSCGRSMTTGL